MFFFFQHEQYATENFLEKLDYWKIFNFVPTNFARNKEIIQNISYFNNFVTCNNNNLIIKFAILFCQTRNISIMRE